ncbi:MAG: 2-amino-3,7-dideoxy-D-threo-hept-6-ulosonate synthase [Candidatus ainarchaeum sp.]|nr:2-amino-3,7-dideoxy-D-threo-hept-6-ulosonate synthase [Candidatus ainarchaeum sp.]
MIGKMIRMQRIMDRGSGKMVIVPIDHGISDGPIDGLINVRETVSTIAESGANGILMHKGMVQVGFRGGGSDIGLIVHLSAGTMLSPDPLNKVIVTTVEEAVALGADAISIHINVGATDTGRMMLEAGEVARDCKRLGMPLLMMMYPRGEKVSNEKDVSVVKIAARIGAELGADIVKTNYTGSKESFREVVEGCPVPVVIAGGCKGTDREVLQMIKDAMDAGASGVALGRNAFQHKEPKKMIGAVSLIVNKGYSVDDAINKVGLKDEIKIPISPQKSFH